MGERLRENFFLIVRIAVMAVLCIYGFSNPAFNEHNTGVSVRVLLLVSLYISVSVLREFIRRNKLLFILVNIALAAALIWTGGIGFILLFIQLLYEILILLDAKAVWYFSPFLLFLADTPLRSMTSFIFMILIMLLYMQYRFVVLDYKREIMEETVSQQSLKRTFRYREDAAREEIKKNALMAENKILEERASLSQTLHDKLGHNINGSIYQLEACKLILKDDPDKAEGMISVVIDRLRSGMDETRMILRKERREKQKMAHTQLPELSEDCIDKGVETVLITEGDMEAIPNNMWEIMLDNTFEAVTNSMKYSRCNRIEIKINVMNKMIRCEILDNGVGCDMIVDGMGISGMRRRVRSVGGTIDFATEAGFSVSMLLPL